VKRRAGVQTEVLVGLGLVMGLATLVLTALFVAQQEAGLRAILGRSLLVEARSPRTLTDSVFPGTQWWTVAGDGHVAPRGPASGVIDSETRELAERARGRGEPLLMPGSVWDEIRFAAPVDGSGTVVVGRLPRRASYRLRAVPLTVVAAMVVTGVLVFTAFGTYLLRLRVVLPLQRLSAAAQEIAGGALATRVPVGGAREAAELGMSFNEMTDALEARTTALEKAVVDLRAANRDLRRARAGLDRAERLAAVGRLAAGVAHELGNPIGAMLALLDLASRDSEISQATRGHLERAGREGQRVRTILRQLLDFSRPPRPTPASLDLGALAEETVALVSAQRRYQGVRFEVHREGAPPPVRADSGAVTQILLNLVLNAADAVAGIPEPRVTLRVRPTAIHTRAGDAAGEAPERRTPDGVECVVVDNGCGIAEADRERVFDPFYTSKPPGEGTGLGLANAVRLADELEGQLELVAAPEGASTAFALRLPAAEEGGESPSARGHVGLA
jgi:two-component system NtrC family sensor kinase